MQTDPKAPPSRFFAGRQQCAHEQDQDMLPNGSREEGPKGLQPCSQHIGSTAGGGGDSYAAFSNTDALQSSGRERKPEPAICSILLPIIIKSLVRHFPVMERIPCCLEGRNKAKNSNCLANVTSFPHNQIELNGSVPGMNA